MTTAVTQRRATPPMVPPAIVPTGVDDPILTNDGDEVPTFVGDGADGDNVVVESDAVN